MRKNHLVFFIPIIKTQRHLTPFNRKNWECSFRLIRLLKRAHGVRVHARLLVFGWLVLISVPSSLCFPKPQAAKPPAAWVSNVERALNLPRRLSSGMALLITFHLRCCPSGRQHKFRGVSLVRIQGVVYLLLLRVKASSTQTCARYPDVNTLKFCFCHFSYQKRGLL